jgi:hypothetical protein
MSLRICAWKLPELNKEPLMRHLMQHLDGNKGGQSWSSPTSY